jgi:hypothetical protein
VFTSAREVDTVGVCACVRESVLNESGSGCGMAVGDAGSAARGPLRGPRSKQVGRNRKAGEMAENRGDELAIRNEDGHLRWPLHKKMPKPTPRKEGLDRREYLQQQRARMKPGTT